MRPDSSEYGSYFGNYIGNVPEDDVVAALASQRDETRKFLAAIPEERASYRYAAGKWSIREVVGHFTDAERVFAYRAMAIARGERQSLPGFDENLYVETAGFDSRTLRELADACLAVRNASLMLYGQLSAQAWDRSGLANNNPVSVRALAYITVGHERHHLRILRERYA
jgi:uncharacterized damage-inducible protein DinB